MHFVHEIGWAKAGYAKSSDSQRPSLYSTLNIRTLLQNLNNFIIGCHSDWACCNFYSRRWTTPWTTVWLTQAESYPRRTSPWTTHFSHGRSTLCIHEAVIELRTVNITDQRQSRFRLTPSHHISIERTIGKVWRPAPGRIIRTSNLLLQSEANNGS